MKGKLLFLGSGASAGIPEIGCDCSVCQSTNEKNKRLRPSCLIKLEKKQLLVDASPDFRYQALKYKINHIDGLLLTHGHYDHTGGIDELRTLNLKEKKAIDCLLSKETLEVLKKSYYYLFLPKSKEGSLFTDLSFFELDKDSGQISFQGINIFYCSYFQKKTKVTGFKIGKLAYISDIKEYPNNIFDFLKDIDILVLSALRPEPSPVHFGLEEALSFVNRAKPKKTFFTHIAHEMDHEKVSLALPPSVKLAYDGLEIEFDYDK